jgi:hypothetical protein
MSALKERKDMVLSAASKNTDTIKADSIMFVEKLSKEKRYIMHRHHRLLRQSLLSSSITGLEMIILRLQMTV